MSPVRDARPQEAGFTVVELLVVSLVGIILVMGVYQILISQSRLLTQQGESIDARATSRTGAAFLAWELKTAAASGGDLYVISQDSVVLRSVQASGVICSWVQLGPISRYGLRQTSGVFSGTANDSAMVYSVTNRAWGAFNVTFAWNGPFAGTPFCFWADSSAAVPRPEATVQIEAVAALAGLEMGGAVHVFRRTKYGLFARDGRWWLGRRVGAGAWEILTGPMLSPAAGGLTFTYYDANDVVTTDPTLVSRVEFTLRSESYGQLSPGGVVGGHVGDSITMTVNLRNTF